MLIELETTGVKLELSPEELISSALLEEFRAEGREEEERESSELQMKSEEGREGGLVIKDACGLSLDKEGATTFSNATS